MTQILWFDCESGTKGRLEPATLERTPAPIAAWSNITLGASELLAVRCDKSKGLYKARQAS